MDGKGRLPNNNLHRNACGRTLNTSASLWHALGQPDRRHAPCPQLMDSTINPPAQSPWRRHPAVVLLLQNRSNATRSAEPSEALEKRQICSKEWGATLKRAREDV